MLLTAFPCSCKDSVRFRVVDSTSFSTYSRVSCIPSGAVVGFISLAVPVKQSGIGQVFVTPIHLNVLCHFEFGLNGMSIPTL